MPSPMLGPAPSGARWALEQGKHYKDSHKTPAFSSTVVMLGQNGRMRYDTIKEIVKSGITLQRDFRA